MTLVRSDLIASSDVHLLPSDIPELDLVYGGGLPFRCVHLWSAAPGTGKSTLATQVALNFAEDFTVLYVSGEEGAGAFARRSERLGGGGVLHVLESGDMDTIIAAIYEVEATFIVVDSIQSCTLARLPGQAGSPSQVVACIKALKAHNIATNATIIVISHQNKAGGVLGPRGLEHEVDSTMLMAGDKSDPDIRTFRCIKNRSGPSDVSASLRMTATGLRSLTPETASKSPLGDVDPGSWPLARVAMTGWALLLVWGAFNGGGVIVGWFAALVCLIALVWSVRLNRAILGGIGLLVGIRLIRWVTRG